MACILHSYWLTQSLLQWNIQEDSRWFQFYNSDRGISTGASGLVTLWFNLSPHSRSQSPNSKVDRCRCRGLSVCISWSDSPLCPPLSGTLSPDCPGQQTPCNTLFNLVRKIMLKLFRRGSISGFSPCHKLTLRAYNNPIG